MTLNETKAVLENLYGKCDFGCQSHMHPGCWFFTWHNDPRILEAHVSQVIGKVIRLAIWHTRSHHELLKEDTVLELHQLGPYFRLLK